MAPEVTHGGETAMAHLDQTGRRKPLEPLTDSGPGYAEDIRQPALAGQRLAGLHLPAEHVGGDLLENLLRHRSTSHRLQRHATWRWS